MQLGKKYLQLDEQDNLNSEMMAGCRQQAKAGFNLQFQRVWNKLELEMPMEHLCPPHPCLKNLALNCKVHLCSSKSFSILPHNMIIYSFLFIKGIHS